MARIAVVGGTGNIGTALLRELALHPETEVVGVSRRAPADLPPYDTATWHQIDVGEPGAEQPLELAFREVSAVVNLSWQIQPSHDRARQRATNVAGARRVAQAAARAGARCLVQLSSIGAYSPGSKRIRVGEDWPTGGVRSSSYSRDKADVEHLLDVLEAGHPDLAVVRVRPALVLQRGAGSEITRYFLGPLVPRALLRLVRDRRLPVLPLPRRFQLQFVHADDVAAALALVLDANLTGGGFRGGLNLAAEPPLGPAALAELFGARHLPVPEPLLRAAAAVTWRLRLQPTAPGWVDLALATPLLDTTRARRELGWLPTRDAPDTLTDLLGGMADGAGEASPPLRPANEMAAAVPPGHPVGDGGS